MFILIVWFLLYTGWCRKISTNAFSSREEQLYKTISYHYLPKSRTTMYIHVHVVPYVREAQIGLQERLGVKMERWTPVADLEFVFKVDVLHIQVEGFRPSPLLSMWQKMMGRPQIAVAIIWWLRCCPRRRRRLRVGLNPYLFTRIRGPGRLLSPVKVNSLKGHRQAGLHASLSQGQTPRYPHVWLKVSGSPGYPCYDRVDHKWQGALDIEC